MNWLGNYLLIFTPTESSPLPLNPALKHLNAGRIFTIIFSKIHPTICFSDSAKNFLEVSTPSTKGFYTTLHCFLPKRLISTYRLLYKALLGAYFMLASILAYSYTLKVDAICSSWLSVDFQRTTRHYFSKYKIIQIRFSFTYSNIISSNT
jgi:hypothetical protein